MTLIHTRVFHRHIFSHITIGENSTAYTTGCANVNGKKSLVVVFEDSLDKDGRDKGPADLSVPPIVLSFSTKESVMSFISELEIEMRKTWPTKEKSE